MTSHSIGQTVTDSSQSDPDSPRVYTIKDVARTLHISRTTLLYYESLGVVVPERDPQTGYRMYSDKDILRFMSALLLRNTGVVLEDLGDILNQDILSSACLNERIVATHRRIKYYEAQLECLQKLEYLRSNVGKVEIADVEPYYISYDNAEVGYYNFPKEESLVSLLAHIPIGSLGAAECIDVSGNMTFRWGRTVAVRQAHLISGLSDNLDVIGCCRCAIRVVFNKNIFLEPQLQYRELLDNLCTHMYERGYVSDGLSFSPYSLQTEYGSYYPICIPIKQYTSF